MARVFSILGRLHKVSCVTAGIIIGICILIKGTPQPLVAEPSRAVIPGTVTQSQQPPDMFEVVSIRPLAESDPARVGRGGTVTGGGGCGGNPPVITRGRIVFPNTRIFAVIAWAYDLDCGQASKLGLISGAPQ
jgi:hypothetical protein